MQKIYTGTRTPDGTRVCVTTELQTYPLPHIPYHSPTGFEWGYGGSAPADLALALLVDHLEEKPPSEDSLDHRFNNWTVTSVAWLQHQDFKWHYVAQWADTWELSSGQIATWLYETDRQKIKSGYPVN